MPDKDNNQTPQEKRIEMEKAMRDVEVNSEVNEMAMQQMGALLFKRYEILQVSGFTKEQAFEIVKHRGLL